MIRKIPWWGWVAGVVVVLIIWQSLSGWGMSGKYFNMLLDQIRKDQSQVIKDNKEWIEACETEIAKLAEEKAQIQKEKLILQKKNIESTKEIVRLKGENNELQDLLNRIIISNDPDKLLEDLRSRGINIKRINPR